MSCGVQAGCRARGPRSLTGASADDAGPWEYDGRDGVIIIALRGFKCRNH